MGKGDFGFRTDGQDKSAAQRRMVVYWVFNDPALEEFAPGFSKATSDQSWIWRLGDHGRDAFCRSHCVSLRTARGVFASRWQRPPCEENSGRGFPQLQGVCENSAGAVAQN